MSQPILPGICRILGLRSVLLCLPGWIAIPLCAFATRSPFPHASVQEIGSRPIGDSDLRGNGGRYARECDARLLRKLLLRSRQRTPTVMIVALSCSGMLSQELCRCGPHPPPRTPPSCGRPTRTRRTVRPAVLCGVLCRRAGVVEVVAGHDDERRHIDLLEVRPLLHLRGCRQMGSPASAARRGDPWTSAQRIRTPAPVAIPRPGQPWGRGQEPGAPGPIPAPGAAPRTAGKRVPPTTRPRPRPGRCPERPAGRHGPPGRDGCILGQGSAEVAEPRGGDDAEILPMRSMLGGVPGRSRPWRRGPIARDPPIPLRRTRSTRRRSRRYGCRPPGDPEPAGSPLALRGDDTARHRGSDAEPRREPAVKSFPYHLHHPDRPTGSSMAYRDYPRRSISTPSHRTLPVPLPAGTNPSTPRS